MKKKMIDSVFIAVMTALVLFAEPVAATDYTGAAGEGDTLVTSSYCSANVEAWVQYALDIDEGEDIVYIYYNITWEDTRSSPAIKATHTFNMTITYLGSDTYWEREEDTYGATSDSYDYYEMINNPYEGEYIHINWTAEIDSTSPLCKDRDKKYGNVPLV